MPSKSIKRQHLEETAIFVIASEEKDWVEQIMEVDKPWNIVYLNEHENIKDHPYTIAVLGVYGKMELNKRLKIVCDKIKRMEKQ